MEAIVVALVTAVAAVAVALLNRSKLKEVDRKLTTNHGKDAFEYLEMVAVLVSDVAELKKGQVDMQHSLLEHTVQDAENFSEIKRLIATKQDKV